MFSPLDKADVIATKIQENSNGINDVIEKVAQACLKIRTSHADRYTKEELIQNDFLVLLTLLVLHNKITINW